ncbi:MAG TPA: contact-dependent growth inhibition system immunity protein [Ohtaekwangia sp.]|nr:contact-dependent growth inhibition system immunity protein [Ohtaekwangia sp.]
MKRILENNWRHKTIESLENRNFGNPSEAPTNMVKRCLELCKVPLNNFTVEDLRLMIEQDFSPRCLVPLAIEHLRTDVFAEGDFFPGDLLKTILLIDINFWKENKSLWIEIDDLIKNRRNELSSNKIPTTLFDSAFDGQ